MFNTHKTPLVITDAQKELLNNLKPTEQPPKRKKTNHRVVNQMKKLRELKFGSHS